MFQEPRERTIGRWQEAKEIERQFLQMDREMKIGQWSFIGGFLVGLSIGVLSCV